MIRSVSVVAVLAAAALAPSLGGVLAGHAAGRAPSVGPRGPVGPDVPLNAGERRRLARRVAVAGRTAADVQAACERAAKEAVRVVFLPAGEYVFESEVKVPAGLTLLGEGARTVIHAGAKDTHLLSADGDRVRITRLKLQGADTTTREDNDTYGISVDGRQNVRIDHCELWGFSYATTFGSEASAQVDHCFIHDNATRGPRLRRGDLLGGLRADRRQRARPEPALPGIERHARLEQP